MIDNIRIGSRGSRLALWQSEEVSRQLSVPSTITVIKTSGDRFLNMPLQGQLEKGFFTKEIEDALLANDVDIAVHSLKDLPTEFPPGLRIGAYMKRAPVADLLLIHPDWHDPNGLMYMKDGCRVGATSLRRQAFVRLFNPRVNPDMLRGNVPTRVRKCVEGQYGAIVLARAGVERLQLDLEPLIVYELKPEIWLPAPGQGAMAIEMRQEDTAVDEALLPLDDPDTRIAVELERRLLANFGGGCHTAFGAYAVKEGDSWTVHAGLETPEGWQNASFSGLPEELSIIGPEDMEKFTVRTQADGGELCTPFQSLY